MVDENSGEEEIKDLQRMLIHLGLMEFRSSSRNGTWDEPTQQAVLSAYTRLGWDHAEDAKWISAPALAAGLVIGILVTWLVGRVRRARLKREIADLEDAIKTQEAVQLERDAAFQAASGEIARSFGDLANRSLQSNSETFLRLAEHVLAKLGAAATLDESARSALLAYGFPGNVRELENMLERAVTLCTSGTIGEADLNLRGAPAADGGTSDHAATDLSNQVEDVQRQAIVEALEKTRYNKTAAAKLLGLTFRQLRYRIKKLGIE